ncbi:MAG: hypothetical protein K0Q63_1003 [Paenibacillus sp.]|nr:hypothetical protein [Paenibacillus sp.]
MQIKSEERLAYDGQLTYTSFYLPIEYPCTLSPFRHGHGGYGHG